MGSVGGVIRAYCYCFSLVLLSLALVPRLVSHRQLVVVGAQEWGGVHTSTAISSLCCVSVFLILVLVAVGRIMVAVHVVLFKLLVLVDLNI